MFWMFCRRNTAHAATVMPTDVFRGVDFFFIASEDIQNLCTCMPQTAIQSVIALNFYPFRCRSLWRILWALVCGMCNSALARDHVPWTAYERDPHLHRISYAGQQNAFLLTFNALLLTWFHAIFTSKSMLNSIMIIFVICILLCVVICDTLAVNTTLRTGVGATQKHTSTR
jgi:hypothetical protein